MTADHWPRKETCVRCGKFGSVWWFDAKPHGYVCGICADPEGFKQFCQSLDNAQREAGVREGRQAKDLLRRAAD